MTTQPADTTRTHNLTTALADFTIPCDFGSFPRGTRKRDRCEAPAEWSFKVHSTSLSGTCPEAVLVCEEHLHAFQESSKNQLQKVLALAVCSHSVLRCALCRLPLSCPDDVLWGIEKIRQ